MARDNVSALMEGKFNFSPEQFLNKMVLFDISKVNEENIIDRIIENLPKDNDELYIVHEDVKMRRKIKTLQETKNLFENLKTDFKSVLFSEEKLNNKLLKKFKNSSYSKDKLLLKLIKLIENDIDQINKTKEDEIPTRADYVEKREIYRSTLYSFNGPFQLLHADVGNLEFLGKSASVPNYALLIEDLHSSKVYIYPVHSRKQILQELEQFYVDVQSKRKNQNTRLQVDNQFQQLKIKDLNDKCNVTMFTTSLRGGKALAAEQKIRELKSRISNVKAILDKNKAKVPPVTIINNLLKI